MEVKGRDYSELTPFNPDDIFSFPKAPKKELLDKLKVLYPNANEPKALKAFGH